MEAIRHYEGSIRHARYEVEVDLVSDAFRTTLKQVVGGNVKGFEIIDSAVEELEEMLYEVEITLTDDSGATLIIEPCNVGFKEYVVAARIVKVTPR